MPSVQSTLSDEDGPRPIPCGGRWPAVDKMRSVRENQRCQTVRAVALKGGSRKTQEHQFLNLLCKTILVFALASASTLAAAGVAEGLEDMKAKNWSAAISEFTPAAEQGDPVAQYNLGRLYVYGYGTAVDLPKGVGFYTQAANQGYANAEYGLGLLYQSGTGVPKDANKVAELWTKAADQHFGVADHGLAIIYQGNLGIPRDSTQVISHYRRAITEGYTPSIFNLGVLYANGAPDVPKNLALAYVVFGLAPASDANSLGYRGIVGAKLTPEQRAKCDAVIASWSPGSPVPESIPGL